MATMSKLAVFAVLVATAPVAQAQGQATPPWRKAEPARPAAPVPLSPPPQAAASAAALEPAIPVEKPHEPSWYLPQSQDRERPWNSSYWGKYDSWGEPSRAIGVAYRAHSFGVRSLSSSTSDSSTTIPSDLSLSTSLLGARLEFGPSFAIELGSGTFSGTSGAQTVSTSGFGFGTSVLTGRMLLWDAGLPDVQVGLLFPELYFTGTYATPDANVSVFTGSVGLNAIGVRAMVMDFVKVDLMVLDIGYDFMLQTESTSSSSGLSVSDTLSGTGFRFDPLAVTFRASIVF